MRAVKGGYIVDVFWYRGVLAMSLSAFKAVESWHHGAQLQFVVAKMNKQRRNLILSRREMVQKEGKSAWKLWAELKKGQKRRGSVKGSLILVRSLIWRCGWFVAYHRYELEPH